MSTPPAQPNLPPAVTLAAGIVPSIWDHANAVCANPCIFNGQNVRRHLIFFIMKADVLSVRLIPTLLLTKDALRTRAAGTPAAATDPLVVKYTTPYFLDHQLASIDGTDPATRLTTYPDWKQHVIRASQNSLTMDYRCYTAPDHLQVSTICEEGYWEGEPCHFSTVFVQTIFTKLENMTCMINRADHLRFIDTSFWDCSTDVIHNQIPDLNNPDARLQTEGTFMTENFIIISGAEAIYHDFA